MNEELEKKEEIWKDVTGYEGLYKISNHGRVLSCKRITIRGNSRTNRPERILSNKFNHQYEFVKLSKNGIRHNIVIHRLVAIHFVENPENKPNVNHKDLNKRNNHYTNLEWVTSSENNIHASVNNCIPHQTPNSIALGIMNLKYNRMGLTIDQIANKFGVGRWTICSIFYKNKKFKNENYSKFRIGA